MADADAGGGQLLQSVAVEYFADKPYIFVAQNGVFGKHGDAGPFLTPVLQSRQGVVSDAGGFLGVDVYPEHAAFFV